MEESNDHHHQEIDDEDEGENQIDKNGSISKIVRNSLYDVVCVIYFCINMILIRLLCS